MPVKKCHKFGNKYYCYNNDNRTVSIFTEQLYQLNECPDYVLADLIGKKENVHIVIDEEAKPLTKEEINSWLETINKD